MENGKSLHPKESLTQKSTIIKTLALIVTTVSTAFFVTLYSAFPERFSLRETKPEKGCAFNSMMGIKSTADYAKYKTPDKVMSSLEHGLGWIATGQRGWDGTMKGAIVEQGVYAYRAIIQFLDGSVLDCSGTTTLIR